MPKYDLSQDQHTPDDSREKAYVPKAPANWSDPDPRTVGEALDDLAAVGGGAALTTKGDLLTHSGTGGQRLAVAADGHVLTADSAETTGLKWGKLGEFHIPMMDVGTHPASSLPAGLVETVSF